MSDDRTYTDEEIEAALSGETVEEPSAEEESTPAEEVVEAPVEPEAPAEPAATDDGEEDPEPEDDWALKARQIQAAKDREVAQAQREAQQLREELAEMRGRQSAQQEMQSSSAQEQASSVTTEDLRAGVVQNLPATFQWTVANRPDLVPSLITMVRETEGLGHGVADQMVVEYTEYKQQLLDQKQEQRWAERTAADEAAQAPLRSKQAMEGVVTSLTERFGDNFEAVRDEIATRMETQGREYINYLAQQDPHFQVTPDLLKDMMVDIYLELREQSLDAAASAPGRPQAVPAAAGALGQTASQAEPEDDSEEFINSFISGAKGADISIDPAFLP